MKFNTSLLKDNDYISLIKTTWDENIRNYVVPDDQSKRSQKTFLVSDLLFFETLEMGTRGKTISYPSFKKHQARKEKESLTIKIKDLKKRMESDASEDLNEKLAEKYQNLNYIRSENGKGTILRSKIKM